MNGAEGPGLDAKHVYDTSVVLRVSHAQLDLEACLTWVPTSRLIRLWRVGERHRRGIHDESGFAVDLAEGLARGSVVQDAVDAFLELAEPVAELLRALGWFCTRKHRR